MDGFCVCINLKLRFIKEQKDNIHIEYPDQSHTEHPDQSHIDPVKSYKLLM